MAENNEYWVNEDGDANIYTVLKGNKTWIAKVQLNGEIHLDRQREIMANMVADLNKLPKYKCSIPLVGKCRYEGENASCYNTDSCVNKISSDGTEV